MTGSTDRPLRAGVVGLGMMGRNHVRVWDDLVDDVDLVAVADPDPRALAQATAGRRARGFDDAERMLAEEELDLVSIVAPTSLHLAATLAAFRSGANVLVEKPIAATREEAQEMIEAAAAAGRMLTVGHIERFNPAIRELRRRLEATSCGTSSVPSRFASMPRRSSASTPITRICSPARCGSRMGSSAC
jgi:UDP-N-acetylglucosamine 3-dehydrogenase